MDPSETPTGAAALAITRCGYASRRSKLTVFAAHVDNESQRIADANWSGHSSSSGPVTVSDFHVALGRLQGEDYGISRGDSGRRRVCMRKKEREREREREGDARKNALASVIPSERSTLRHSMANARHYRGYYVNGGPAAILVAPITRDRQVLGDIAFRPLARASCEGLGAAIDL
jgi:hypothetical protein